MAAKPRKSLQELSASKSVEQLMKEELPEATFRDLEPVQQELIFSYTLKEYKRLMEIERKYTHLTHSLKDMPVADHALHAGSSSMPRGNSFYKAGIWRYSTHEDLQRMEYRDDRFYQLLEEGQRVRFHDNELYQLSSNGLVRPFTLEERSAVYGQWDREGDSPLQGPFYDLISSQLLLYRLTVTLGPPPSDEMEKYLDGYKTCWGTKLVLEDENADAIVNHLTFGEHKGSATCHFAGTQAGSKKALKLINYLLGKECAHSYDAILAGTQA